MKSITYGDLPTHIDVAEVVETEPRWWDLVCVSTRDRSRFPSVLLQPLGHLSALVSTVYEQSPEIIAHALGFPQFARITFAFSEFDPHGRRRARKMCQTFQCAAITYGDLVELDCCGESGVRGLNTDALRPEGLQSAESRTDVAHPARASFGSD